MTLSRDRAPLAPASMQGRARGRPRPRAHRIRHTSVWVACSISFINAAGFVRWDGHREEGITPDSHSHLGIPTAGGSAVFKVTLGIKIQRERRWCRRNPSAQVTYMCTLSPTLPCLTPLSRTSHTVPPRHKAIGKCSPLAGQLLVYSCTLQRRRTHLCGASAISASIVYF